MENAWNIPRIVPNRPRRGAKVTTVFPRQGHYALDQAEIAKYPPADIVIDRIGMMLDYDLDALLQAARIRRP